jgi:hypothetical protein
MNDLRSRDHDRPAHLSPECGGGSFVAPGMGAPPRTPGRGGAKGGGRQFHPQERRALLPPKTPSWTHHAHAVSDSPDWYARTKPALSIRAVRSEPDPNRSQVGAAA